MERGGSFHEVFRLAVGGGDSAERATRERVQVSVRGADSRLAFMGRCHGRLKKGSHDKGSHGENHLLATETRRHARRAGTAICAHRTHTRATIITPYTHARPVSQYPSEERSARAACTCPHGMQVGQGARPAPPTTRGMPRRLRSPPPRAARSSGRPLPARASPRYDPSSMRPKARPHSASGLPTP